MVLVKSRFQLRVFQDKSRCESMIIMSISQGSFESQSSLCEGLYIITEPKVRQP